MRAILRMSAMRKVGILVALVLGGIAACSGQDSNSKLEATLAADYDACTAAHGLATSETDFVVTGTSINDFNTNYPGQGSQDADNVSNACLIEVLEANGVQHSFP